MAVSLFLFYKNTMDFEKLKFAKRREKMTNIFYNAMLIANVLSCVLKKGFIHFMPDKRKRERE